jgi:hypothetical protein
MAAGFVVVVINREQQHAASVASGASEPTKPPMRGAHPALTRNGGTSE